MNKILKSTIIILGIGFLIYLIGSLNGAFDKDYTKQDLIDNYKAKQTEINELKNYFNSITPKDLEVYIEFESKDEITLQVYFLTKPKYPRKTFFGQWHLNPFNSGKPQPSPFDSTEFAAQTNSLEVVKKRLGWTDQTFKEIKKYLDNANCISITNGEPTNIGYQRSGMGQYFYNVFATPIPDSMKTYYANDSCKYIPYNDNVVLEYGGGAIGPQCF